MGSVGNPNPWTPYDNYRDCSQGICSIYCPQFCYLIFPPPPPSNEDSRTQFSPLIIAIIAVLTSAFLLVSYYTIFTRYCRRRNDRIAALEAAENRGEVSDQWQVARDGLDEELIKTITVCKYRRGDGLIEGTDCAVCLSEFQDNESLRLLPKCSHAFHLPCIDTWLKSQSNCPLCRANVVVVAPPLPNFQTSSALSVNSYEVRRPDDLVMVVDDQEVLVVHEENGNERDEGGFDRFRRSVSLGTFSSNRQLLISDILKFEEIDECVGVENEQLWRGVGSSKGVGLGLLRSPLAMEKFISSGGFVFRTNDKGENSILSN